jgi:hypothetical protein
MRNFWVGLTLSAAFAASGGVPATAFAHTAVALEGDTAPGTGGGTYASFRLFPISASGDVVFSAGVTGGTVGEGIFVDSGGTHRAVALIGDMAPGTGGGTYSRFEGHSINGASINAFGDVAFNADLEISPYFITNGIFVDSGGTDRAVALSTDTAPGTGGGTYFNFSSFSINASGDVVFIANLAQGIFVDSGGTDRAVALGTDTAPGTGGGTYGGGWNLVKPINDSGDVVFPSLVTGGTVREGIFVDSGGTDTAVALSGNTAPGTGGGTYWSISNASINASGDVVFSARVAGSTVDSGIFVPEPSRWLLQVAGICFLAVLYRLRGSRKGALT